MIVEPEIVLEPRYFAKELSWLSFNERVLQEAKDKTNPVVERLRFLGIFSNNMDEFFKVRVADVKRRILLSKIAPEKAQGDVELLQSIQQKVLELNTKFEQIYSDIKKDLERHNINIVAPANLSDNQQKWLRRYFKSDVLQHLCPIAITNSPQKLIALNDAQTYILVGLYGDKTTYAALEVPSNQLGRFIQLPAEGTKRRKNIVLIDDIVMYFLGDVFAGIYPFEQVEGYSFKLTRDAEYNLDDELDEGLLDKFSRGLKQRLNSEPVRLVYDASMPDEMLRVLCKRLGIKGHDATIASGRYRNFRDFISFKNVGAKYLENKALPPIESAAFSRFENVFEAITAQDILLYYPYHRFNHMTEFLRQAAYDPQVTQIKINIYRVARHSLIMDALLNAARNGKKVTVMVELKARFDEQNNIEWARVLNDAGIKVIFGIESLKVHSKLCLVYRLENGELCRYTHIGTGNFHEKTAKIYTDFSLFTKNAEIAKECSSVFRFIQHSYKSFKFNHLLVSPVNQRQQIVNLINNEINAAQLRKSASIDLKINNLVDDELIEKLYEASQKGVKIRIIVRGMCALVPGIKGQSDNIKVVSIVDRFLEHARVMVFHNNGQKRVYISSADWMTRNLDHRVEVSTPIYDLNLQQFIIDILELQFNDRAKARAIDAEQKNNYVKRGNKLKLRSQTEIYEFIKRKESQT